jgi:outer membrane receptor protein involved in Fe transport
MQISLWGRNLTDERYFNGAKDYSGNLGMANEVVGQPRTYGVEVTKRF